MNFFSKGKKKKDDSTPSSPTSDNNNNNNNNNNDNNNSNNEKYINLLVIDSDAHNWYELFKDVRCDDGSRVRVDKTRWENMMVSSDQDKAMVFMKPNQSPIAGTNEKNTRQFAPDFVLVRKLVRGLTPEEDYTNALYGLLFCNLPAVNSLSSVHMCLERPAVYAALNEIKNRVGKEKFPLISQSYYSHQNTMLFTPEYPFVVKIGSAEAGYGKMKFETSNDFTDFRGVLALHKDYVTIESFVKDKEYDLRIQKIGDNYRCYKRISANWKGNVGSSVIEEIRPVPDEYRFWAEQCGQLFGGIDILTVDAIYKDGKHYILEINDTASGFYGPNEKEDMSHVRDLVVQRMNEKICSKK